MASKRVLLGTGGGATRSWTFLAGAAPAVLLFAIPAREDSPCDSPTVVPEGLFLHSNRLTGLIPAELGELSKLSFLDLGGNSFMGSIPPQLGRLPS